MGGGRLRGGGGGGGRLCEILAKWGVGVYPDRGINPRGYGNRISSVQFYKVTQTRDHLAYKTTVKYPKEQFVIAIDWSLTPPVL